MWSGNGEDSTANGKLPFAISCYYKDHTTSSTDYISDWQWYGIAIESCHWRSFDYIHLRPKNVDHEKVAFFKSVYKRSGSNLEIDGKISRLEEESSQ